MAIVLAMGAVYVFLVAYPHHYPTVRHSSTFSNIKRMLTGTAIYATDFDEKFPLDTSSGAAAKPALLPYVKNTHVFHSDNQSSEGFLGNGSLGGRETKTVADPMRTVIFYDSAPWKGRNARYVGYVDTSARPVKEPKFQSAAHNGMVTVP